MRLVILFDILYLVILFLNPSFKMTASFANIARTQLAQGNKLKLDIDFLNNCKQLGVYLEFLIFKLPNVSSKDASSICKRLLHSAINNHNKEL